MTISEALKEEQRILGLNNKQMAAGIVSEGTYSKVVNGKQTLASELLIKLLLFHDINIANFFSKVEDEYIPKSRIKEKQLLKKITTAANNRDIENARKYADELIESSRNQYLIMRIVIAISYLDNSLDKLSVNFRQRVIDQVNSNANWVMNLDALKLFSTAIVVLPAQTVEQQMKLFFIKLRRKHKLSDELKERYAMICDNYLHWKFEQNNLKNKENIKNAIKYLIDLPPEMRMVIFRISGVYYQRLFAGNIKEAKEMHKQLIKMGCTTGVKNWPV